MASSREPAPADFSTSDHYAVLGVERSATDTEIARAYKALARRHHPDKNPGRQQEAEASFKRVAEAYDVLRDAGKRREYDNSGGTRSYVSYEEAERMWRSYGSGGDADEAPNARDEMRRKGAGLIVALVALFLAPRMLLTTLLPGLTAVLVGVAMLSRRDGVDYRNKWAWCALALLIAGYAAPWALKARSGLAARPLEGAEPPSGAGAFGATMGMPHSGEEVLVDDGRFIRVSDPARAGEDAVDEGWQQRLVTEMTGAIKSGQEQVVTVFSRQGCPWCDRLLPVLRRAIQLRAAGGDLGEGPAEAEAAPAFLGGAATAFLGGQANSAPSLLATPLRVFVLDAGEFPQLAQAFRVEAFPTIIAWGSPGVTPMAAQGYLDDANFQELLKTIAAEEPEDEAGGPAGGKKRRGLFR